MGEKMCGTIEDRFARERPGRTRLGTIGLVVLLAFTLVASGCGARIPMSQIEAASGSGSGSTSSGSGSLLGSGGSASSGGAASSGGSGTVGATSGSSGTVASGGGSGSAATGQGTSGAGTPVAQSSGAGSPSAQGSGGQTSAAGVHPAGLRGLNHQSLEDRVAVRVRLPTTAPRRGQAARRRSV